MEEVLHKSENGNGFTRSLRDVITTDYFATHKLIREIFCPDFDNKTYDTEITEVVNWLNEHPMHASGLASKQVPDVVKKYRLTAGVYLELKEEVSKRDPIFEKPVAYPLYAKGLRDKDMEEVKRGLNRAFVASEEVMSFVIFLKYWNLLNARAKSHTASGNHRIVY